MQQGRGTTSKKQGMQSSRFLSLWVGHLFCFRLRMGIGNLNLYDRFQTMQSVLYSSI